MPSISGLIEFWASSGAPCHPRQIVSLIVGSGQDYNRIGFFGPGGPGNFITINYAQDTTYIVNEDGNPSGAWQASGRLQNNAYVSANSVNPNSSGSIATSSLAPQDATFIIRVTGPSGNQIQLQNVTFRAVKFNAFSGVDDANQKPSGALIYAFEVGRGSGWTLISQTGTNNYFVLTSRSGLAIVHDYHIAVSAIPTQVGIKKDFGFEVVLEYI